MKRSEVGGSGMKGAVLVAVAVLIVWGVIAFLGKGRDPIGRISKADKRFQVALITNGPLDDWGFNYSHARAIESAQKSLNNRINAVAIGNVPETGEAERIMRRLIENGANLIIAASFGYQDTTVKLASEFPGVKFLQAWGFKPAKNLGTFSAKMYEAWYAMGVLAGRMSKSGKLGVVAAHPIPPMKWQMNAYALGAKSVNPKTVVSVVFINHWFDPGLASDAANTLVDQGCDVLCGILDNSVAVAQTARKRGMYLVGHNTDLSKFAPDSCLGGTEWLWGNLYTDAIRAMLDGKWDGMAGDLNGGFKEGYVGVTAFGGMVPEPVRKQVEKTVEQIKKGTLAVYKGPIKSNDGKIAVPSGKVLSHGEIMGMGWMVEGIK